MIPAQQAASTQLKDSDFSTDTLKISVPPGVRFAKLIMVSLLFLFGAALLSLWTGYRLLNLSDLYQDPVAQTLLFRLRLPRVLLAGVVGASLGMVGAALQAVFRNPLAEP